MSGLGLGRSHSLPGGGALHMCRGTAPGPSIRAPPPPPPRSGQPRVEEAELLPLWAEAATEQMPGDEAAAPSRPYAVLRTQNLGETRGRRPGTSRPGPGLAGCGAFRLSAGKVAPRLSPNLPGSRQVARGGGRGAKLTLPGGTC